MTVIKDKKNDIEHTQLIKTTDDLSGGKENDYSVLIALGVIIFSIILLSARDSSFPKALFLFISVLFSNVLQLWPFCLGALAIFAFGCVKYRNYFADTKKIKINDLMEDGFVVGRMSLVDDRKVRPNISRQRTSSFGSGRVVSGVLSKRKGPTKTQFVSWKALHTVYVDDSNRGGDYKYLYLGTLDGKLYQIEKENAFWWVKEETFFSAVRANCPKITLDVPVKISQSADVKYTHLWLENFSNSEKRVRVGDLESGDTLNNGQYAVDSKLGAGGQGSAYLANQNFDSEKVTSNRQVVLKEYILPANRGAELEENKSRSLQNEAELLSKIDHPQIVSLLDCFVEDHRGYLVLEYISGVSLRELVKKNGAQSEKDVVNWSMQVCDVLNYLHNLIPPIIHRDLTPDNLILDNQGKVHLFDFTVAHQFESSRSATVVGKQSYIPPEQFCGEPATQSDIYALGCSMFYLLTGNDPEPMERSYLRSEKPETSDKLNSAVSKATQLDLKNRYATALHMKADLYEIGSN